MTKWLAGLRNWAASLVFVAPLLVLYFTARWTTGWVSIAAWVALFAVLAGLFAWGIVLEGRAWIAIDDEFDHRAEAAARDRPHREGDSWRTPTRAEIESLLASEVTALHPRHRERFAAMRVPWRTVPVAAWPGEQVWVVGEHDGAMLYYSDVEEGWAMATPDAAGGIRDRDCNQLTLSHVMGRLFGDPGRDGPDRLPPRDAPE